MERKEILRRLNEIFKDAFDNEDIILAPDTDANSIEGWDSLMQINLIEMIEAEFNISFTMDEIIEMRDVASMIDTIVLKKA